MVVSKPSLKGVVIEEFCTSDVASSKALFAKANMVEDKLVPKRYKKNNNDNKFSCPNGTNTTFKKKGNCFVSGRLGHHAPQCKHRVKNENSPKTNIVTIVVIVSQVNLVTNVSK